MDPVLIWSGSIVFFLLFLSAGVHKITAPAYYRGLIGRYLPLPPVPAGVAGSVAGITEISTGILILLPVSRPVAAWCALALLLAYFLLIMTGLLRGLDMDCGCSGPLGRQKLSVWLLFRNLVLAAGVWLLTMPSTSRLTGVADIMIVVCSSAALIMIYISFEHLLANQEKLASLRS